MYLYKVGLLFTFQVTVLSKIGGKTAKKNVENIWQRWEIVDSDKTNFLWESQLNL